MNKGTPADPLREAQFEAWALEQERLHMTGAGTFKNKRTRAAWMAALATKSAEPPKRVERVDNIGNPGQGHPTESAGKAVQRPVDMSEGAPWREAIWDDITAWAAAAPGGIAEHYADRIDAKLTALVGASAPAETQRLSNANGSDKP